MPAVACPSCAARLRAPDQAAAGRKLPCPRCKTLIAVPANTSSQVVVAARPTPAAVAQLPVALMDCPFCGENVLATARKCKHCGEIIDVAERTMRGSARRRRDEEDDESPRRTKTKTSVAAAAASTTVIVQAESGKFPHLLHFAMTVLTCGMWAPVWSLHALFRAR
jgi:hypothetical protein